ncbi:hypothetical protein JXA56_01210 [Candidatus Micrarchaeota archaeon]|nr:hypothetical protein [Candidatus Micrarchaeota archaeon]
MKYAILLAIILIAGCTSDNGPADTTGTVPAGTSEGPEDRSGTITTTGYADCMERCESGGPGTGPYCKDGCRFEQAENTKDLFYCNQMDQKESIPECYGTVAIAAGDIKICDKLSNPEDRNHCLAAFSPR